MRASPDSRPRVPRIGSAFWRVSNNPDLGDFGSEAQEVVDHAIWQADNGMWQLWACIRGTGIGRLLYRWQGTSIDEANWEPQGIAMRAQAEYGESLEDWNNEEWIQAPHVFVHNGSFYMMYGGHRTENGHCQICLAASDDGGIHFTKHSNRQGYSRVFVGPGEARDPMVLKIDGLFHCYYSGNNMIDTERPGHIFCRTSENLYDWSEPIDVCWGGSGGRGPWSAECPFVVQQDGFFYLFRTSRYHPPAVTHVYRSKDPLHFGLDEDSKKIATISVAAPEIVQVGSDSFISSVEDLRGGVQIARLHWGTQ